MLRLLSVIWQLSVKLRISQNGVKILKLGYKINLWLINYFGVNKKVNIPININFNI